MSGHSKWKNIMHKKEKTDSQRAKIFTKAGREIAIAVKEGGPDPASNSKLKDIIASAKQNNVPNDNIERIIKKAAGAGDANTYENIAYEGYGPCGVAIIVETLTDNRNRTAGDMRHYFDKFGGNLGASGSVIWQFKKKGMFIVDSSIKDIDAVITDALDCGADDVEDAGEIFEISCDPDDFYLVLEGLKNRGYVFLKSGVEYVPENFAELKSEEDFKNMEKLMSMLEDNDDVSEVYHNCSNYEE